MAIGIDCVGWLSFGVRWDGRRDIIFESALDLVLGVGCYCGCYCGLLGLGGTWWIEYGGWFVWVLIVGEFGYVA